MNIIQKILLSYVAFNCAFVAICVGYFSYDVVTSIRAWMKRRKEYTGKEEPHNGISESGR